VLEAHDSGCGNDHSERIAEMMREVALPDKRSFLRRLQRDLWLSMLFITHNLPLVRSVAQRVAVMHQGNIVELGDVGQVLADPRQPYTRQLVSDTPSLETAIADVGLGEPSGT